MTDDSHYKMSHSKDAEQKDLPQPETYMSRKENRLIVVIFGIINDKCKSNSKSQDNSKSLN